MAVEFPEHPFWDFSIRVYSSAGVGQACLGLQARHEVDVNILMLCCWLGASGRGSFAPGEAATVIGTVKPWHDQVVRGLRAVRTAMKGGMPSAPAELAEGLRRRIAKTEVDCEHVEQLMLAAAAERPADEARAAEQRCADAALNIAAYLTAHGVRRLGDDDRTDLRTLLAAAFPPALAEQVEHLARELSLK